MSIAITRTAHRLSPNPRRVLAKPYFPGEEIILPGPSRTGSLLSRILEIAEDEVTVLLDAVLANFALRHRNFYTTLEKHFELVRHHIDPAVPLSQNRRLLIGAYFTHEYSVESAALFNPSIVPAPDQTNLASGQQRFIMSLRAVGEGHLSSIEFRTGLIDAGGELAFDPTGDFLVPGRRTPPGRYDKRLFAVKLAELEAHNDVARQVLDRLSDSFSLLDLESTLVAVEQSGPQPAIWFETLKIIRVLASSNYVTTFPIDSALSERVIFPAGPNETRGMEDARFVRFVDRDCRPTYYGTYTAYDGFQIVPQLIETEDFLTFSIGTLYGVAAQNKGMALFPRRVNGKYVMLSRRDRENLHIATSDNVRFWDDVTEVYRPSHPWELLHMGNCGSPLETEAGWLVLTHGVGPMRQYVLAAILLDLDDPTVVIGQLKKPLLVPEAGEREGYVPNVLYTCGGLIHGQELILPFGISDTAIGIARVSLPDLLRELRG